MYINDRKYALFVNIAKQPAILILHGPSNRVGHAGIGICVPAPFFRWWRESCVKGNLLTLAAQSKDMESRYTLLYERMAKRKLPIMLRNNLPNVFLSLALFKHEKAPYIKPPRKKK